MIRRGHRLCNWFGSGACARRWSSSSMATQAQPQTRSSTSEKFPSLMVSSASRCVYKLTKDDRYHITNLERHRELALPGIPTDDYILAGYSRGFLFFRPRSGAGDIRAVNPLTGAHFRLPPVVPDPDFPDEDRYGPKKYWIRLARLGPDPHNLKIILSPSLHTALLLRGTSNHKAEFTRLPSSQWTPISAIPCIEDCIFHKKSLYVFRTYPYDTVAAYDEEVFANWPPSREPTPSATWSYDKRPPVEEDDIWSRHLVESPDGEGILLLYRCANWTVGVDGRVTMRWWVYRLQDGGGECELVDTIGDSALFIGQYGGMFLPVDRRDSSCVLEPDSIYFADCRDSRKLPPLEGGLVDTGIYYLKDGAVEFLPVTDTGPNLNHSPPVWLPPTAYWADCH